MDTKLFEAIEAALDVEKYALDVDEAICELSRHPQTVAKLTDELRNASKRAQCLWTRIEQMPEFRAKYKATLNGRFDAQQDFHTELARRNEVD